MTDIRRFVALGRPEWERLEALLARIDRRGLSGLGPGQLRDLGLLHRRVSADLAAARTFHGTSRLVDYLNDLAVRSHNAVYRAPRRGLVRSLRSAAWMIPETVRRHTGALGASALLFFTGTLLGGFGTVLDESVASLILGSRFVESVRSGDYWIEEIFSVVPQSVASAGLLTNNLSVAILAFAVGISGLGTSLLLFLNGAMLGAVLALSGQYGLLDRVAAFVTGHGVVEISAILLAGAGGLLVFDGWVHPGDDGRLDGLRRGAREGLLVAAAAGPGLLVAGFVEGFLSAVEAIPGWMRALLGVSLGLAYWSWLLLYRRPSRLIST